MPPTEPPADQDASLPPEAARRASSRAGATWFLGKVVKSRFAAREEARARFLDLADRLAGSTDAEEQARLKAELTRIAFGD